MRVTLEFDCDNDAFHPDPFEEIGRILRDVAEKVVREKDSEVVIFDVNGNWIGGFSILEHDQ